MERTIRFPTDADGFLTQECPSCARRFKVQFGTGVGAAGPLSRCPYCGHEGRNCWWTQAQVDYIQTEAKEVASDALEDVFRGSQNVRFTRGSRSGGFGPPSEDNGVWATHTFQSRETVKHDGQSADLFCPVTGVREKVAQ